MCVCASARTVGRVRVPTQLPNTFDHAVAHQKQVLQAKSRHLHRLTFVLIESEKKGENNKSKQTPNCYPDAACFVSLSLARLSLIVLFVPKMGNVCQHPQSLNSQVEGHYHFNSTSADTQIGFRAQMIAPCTPTCC